MESLFGWFGRIVEFIGRAIPRREILDTTEGAIKYSGFVCPLVVRRMCAMLCCMDWYPGDFRVTVHEEGIHWWWPWTSKWDAHPMVRQTDRLETQTMESVDGVTFIVGATITYEVRDLEAFVTNVYHPTTTVVDIAMLAVHDVCCKARWKDLQEDQRKDTLRTKLRAEAQSQLKPFGVRVIKLQLNSLARCRVLKVSQSTSSEEN